ncbi:MAG: hypothetical protein ACJ73E_14365, partial [Mycobacteriales bacterium]
TGRLPGAPGPGTGEATADPTAGGGLRAAAEGQKGAPAARTGAGRGTGPVEAPAAQPEGAPVSRAPAVGPVDAAAVRRIWPEVLDAAKRRSRTTHALLMNASVHSVSDGVLTLTISHAPLSRILAQDVNTDVVRGALRDVLGVDWRVQVRVDGGPAVGGADPTPAPPPEEDPRDDEPAAPRAGGEAPARTDPEEVAISLLESTLGARRVEDRP